MVISFSPATTPDVVFEKNGEVPDMVRLEVRGDVEILKVELRVEAKLRGLRWWMYNWRWIAGLIGVGVFWGAGMAGVGVAVWVVGGWLEGEVKVKGEDEGEEDGVRSVRRRGVVKREVKEEEEEGGEDGVRRVKVEDEEEEDRSFGSFEFEGESTEEEMDRREREAEVRRVLREGGHVGASGRRVGGGDDRSGLVRRRG